MNISELFFSLILVNGFYLRPIDYKFQSSVFPTSHSLNNDRRNTKSFAKFKGSDITL